MNNVISLSSNTNTLYRTITGNIKRTYSCSKKHPSINTKLCFRRMCSNSNSSKERSVYGSWKSPITAHFVSAGDLRLSASFVDHKGSVFYVESRPLDSGLGGSVVDDKGRVFYVESRPLESGRAVLVKAPEKDGDGAVDITPKEFAVRTTAQEYGGGAFTIKGDTVIFSNYKDQRLYKQSIQSGDSSPSPLTPDYGGPLACYADGVFDSRFGRFITVREDHREDSLNTTTTIVSIDLNSQTVEEPKVLVGGNDFYAFPRLDPKGEKIAWIEWGHPNMPWDKSELWVGYLSENGDIHKRICVAGGDPEFVESPCEPKWSSKGELYFITDRKSGFWNIYKWNELENKAVPVYSLDAEFTKPLWVFGINSYEIIQTKDQGNLIACNYRQKGRSYFAILDDALNSITLLDIPFTDINNIISGDDYLIIEGASAVHPLSIAKVTLDDHKSKVTNFQIIWSSSPASSKYKEYFSLPELIEFQTEVPGQTAYAYFYPPTNPNYQASPDEKPPLLLRSHGGPTAETRGVLNLSYQYWTSRGWAVVDVNYGGSTGYGREYRERLLRSWGIVDVNDCCSCAKHLVDKGKVDGERLCIVGGSAGGYTTLAALAFKNTFKAGASLYGIGDLAALRAETHKFESHYSDNLIGNEEAYFQRSPINFVEKFSCPILLLQGLEDKVVPPAQARKIYHALKDKGLPVALVEFEGEQHGFRKAETIKFSLEQQMVFFARVVGKFKVADEITPIKIDNFDQD